MKKGFFAYSSNPASCGEAIEDAIKKINEDKTVCIESWRDLKVGGRYIISKILDGIDSSDFFCADLTGINDNVLFELGYAIGKKKSIWLVFDNSQTDSLNKFKELAILSSIGYHPYHNTNNIVSGFYSDQSFKEEKSLYETLVSRHISPFPQKKPLLFLKSQIATNSSLALIEKISDLKLPVIIDDATESKVQSLAWYIEHIFSVPAVLAQFSSVTRSGYELQNSKCSFICGLALGLGRKILMLAETPYETPLDYKELLKKYIDRTTCINVATPFLTELQLEAATLLSKRENTPVSSRTRTDLQNINFGEYIAEHEIENLYEYYVETTHFQSLLKTEYNIVLGRKGSGKTATLYYLNEDLSHDKRNIVCLIKPINFEIDGLLSLLKQAGEEYQKNYLIEAVWKFLIYSEIARTIYEKVKEKNLYALSDEESRYINYIESNKNIFLSDFSTRLEEQLECLKGYDISDGAIKQQEYKEKISEALHDGIIYDLKNWFAVLISSEKKIVVLIDNLDKSWKKNNDLTLLSRCILGLLGVTGRIAKELSFIKSKQIKISFRLIVFLRSDIFRYIINEAREPDKIEHTKLSYADPEVLFRIIEERFIQLNKKAISSEDLWIKYFPSKINNVPIKEFIFNSVYPRPRDLIYFLRSAKDIAVSRGHSTIQEDDVLKAYQEYSAWIFSSVLIENGVTLKQLEQFMYQLMGGNVILTKDYIYEAMKTSNIPHESEEKVNYFLDHLVSLSILGREVRNNSFDFEYDFDGGPRSKALAARLNTNRFKIHNALLPYLECSN